MRPIQHPGPAAARRIDAVPARITRCDVTLAAGQPLLAAVAQALAPHGTRSAVLTLHGGRLWPLATPMAATAWLLDGAEFQGVADVETRFSLFKPVACAAATPLPHPALAAARPALALRLAPNEDVCTALETACRAHGIRQATVCGGVGSTVGAVFDDGRVVQPFVTELLVRRGRVHTGAAGAPVAEIDVSLVDHTGGLADGRLARRQNPVLVTFELVLVPD